MFGPGFVSISSKSERRFPPLYFAGRLVVLSDRGLPRVSSSIAYPPFSIWVLPKIDLRQYTAVFFRLLCLFYSLLFVCIVFVILLLGLRLQSAVLGVESCRPSQAMRIVSPVVSSIVRFRPHFCSWLHSRYATGWEDRPFKRKRRTSGTTPPTGGSTSAWARPICPRRSTR